MKRIGLFGGSFDPIHLGHIETASAALSSGEFDEIWFLLAFKPNKTTSLEATYYERLEMLDLVLKDYANFKSFCYEYTDKKVKYVYTYDTIRKLLKDKIYEDYQFSFIIGNDQLLNFDKWYKYDKLIKLIQIYVISRDHIVDLDLVNKYGFKLIKGDPSIISSTDIREYKMLSGLEVVDQYIVEKYMYLKTRISMFLNDEKYQHTLKVVKTAKLLTNDRRALIACYLHDVAKQFKIEDMNNLLSLHYYKYLNSHDKIKHQYIGEHIAKTHFKITDSVILSAISKHTTADEYMSDIDKIVFIADKLEDSREIPNREKLLKACIKDLDRGFSKLFAELYDALVSKNVIIDQRTNDAYKRYVLNSKVESIVYDVYLKVSKSIISNLEILDVSEKLFFTSTFILCTVSNYKIAEKIKDDLRKECRDIYSHYEGGSNSNWFLIDLHDIIVHVFIANSKEYKDFKDLHKKTKRIKIK